MSEWPPNELDWELCTAAVVGQGSVRYSDELDSADLRRRRPVDMCFSTVVSALSSGLCRIFWRASR